MAKASCFACGHAGTYVPACPRCGRRLQAECEEPLGPVPEPAPPAQVGEALPDVRELMRMRVAPTVQELLDRHLGKEVKPKWRDPERTTCW